MFASLRAQCLGLQSNGSRSSCAFESCNRVVTLLDECGKALHTPYATRLVVASFANKLVHLRPSRTHNATNSTTYSPRTPSRRKPDGVRVRLLLAAVTCLYRYIPLYCCGFVKLRHLERQVQNTRPKSRKKTNKVRNSL